MFFNVGCLDSSLQAAQHPFITDEPFTGPYEPVPESPRTVSVVMDLKEQLMFFPHSFQI